ncbi:MAG: hypothetical protein PHW93_04415 [Candidatus Methanomethylophilaceae archaeon]|jgi:hypothetical protein|nr:hypothetical protein [Candidatus Methanomethylophilaceae archaeon]
MATTEELEEQLKSLKSEMTQMKEIINVLLSMVVEDDEEEEYSAFGGGLDFSRFNT